MGKENVDLYALQMAQLFGSIPKHGAEEQAKIARGYLMSLDNKELIELAKKHNRHHVDKIDISYAKAWIDDLSVGQTRKIYEEAISKYSSPVHSKERKSVKEKTISIRTVQLDLRKIEHDLMYGYRKVESNISDVNYRADLSPEDARYVIKKMKDSIATCHDLQYILTQLAKDKKFEEGGNVEQYSYGIGGL